MLKSRAWQAAFLFDDSLDKSASDWAKETTILRNEIVYLKQRIAWFEKQLFGSKPEKR